MPCDGGAGLSFNIILAFLARALRYKLWTHHHSFAYLNQSSTLMDLLLRASPKGSVHLVLCGRMETLLKERYPEAWRSSRAKTFVLPNAFMLDATSNPPKPEGDMVLGHLSNLTEDKGAIRFLELFVSLRRDGLPVRAHIAGPATDPKIRDIIDATARDFPGTFQWFGPVYGDQKTQFYSGIDVFVFPSAYANEAQPLVLLEALAQGAAILATCRGCIACDHQGSPGSIFDESEFDTAAFDWIAGHAASFNRPNTCEAAVTRFAHLKKEADQALACILAAI